MPVILEEVGFKVTEREFDEVEVSVDFVAFFLRNQTSKASASSSLPMNHHNYDNASTNLSPNPDPDSIHLSWKAKAAAQKTAEQRRSVAGVQRPPSYASWVGRGKEKAKMSLNEELPPRKGTATPPMRTASHEIVHRGDSTTTTTTATATTAAAAAADSSSHSATPTCTPNSNTTSSTSSPSSSSSSSPSTTTTTITFSKLTPHHTTSTIPKTARFDFAANQSRVGGVGEQGWEDQGDDCQSVDDEQEEHGPTLSSSSSLSLPLPPTPSSKSPNAP
ncbi:hypothetical protein LENED_006443 [Lentinula edodes]|uniref:Uncharacterized protein n=1 Tax=Lentinula edodes TaxID=5353 RepID=A0A1Q3EBQ5_LENED|nr:hypothetical protein LENED_006443 [Lentinula edodes]